MTKIVSLVYFDLRELPISIPAWLGMRSDVLGWDRYDTKSDILGSKGQDIVGSVWHDIGMVIVIHPVILHTGERSRSAPGMRNDPAARQE